MLPFVKIRFYMLCNTWTIKAMSLLKNSTGYMKEQRDNEKVEIEYKQSLPRHLALKWRVLFIISMSRMNFSKSK